MHLRVIHDTVYHYEAAVQNALHVAHLCPRDTTQQKVLAHCLQIDPRPPQCVQSQDVYGNTRAFFGLPFTHSTLRVRADSVVQTVAPSAVAASLPWEQVRARLHYRRDATYDAATEFCFASPHVPRHEEFATYARTCFTPERPLMEAACALMRRIHTEFTYAPATTDVSTPALESLALRRGVCQDFAHIMLGCLRSLGLAGRYVSGYLLTEPPPGKPRLIGADASHAWVSVWSPAPDDQQENVACNWHDLDPTNNRAYGEDYVTLAIGRDYADVSPLRGVIHGGGTHVLDVGVTVIPLAMEDASKWLEQECGCAQ